MNSSKHGNPVSGASGQAKGSKCSSKPLHGTVGQAKGMVSSKPVYGTSGQPGSGSGRSGKAVVPPVAD